MKVSFFIPNIKEVQLLDIKDGRFFKKKGVHTKAKEFWDELQETCDCSLLK